MKSIIKIIFILFLIETLTGCANNSDLMDVQLIKDFEDSKIGKQFSESINDIKKSKIVVNAQEKADDVYKYITSKETREKVEKFKPVNDILTPKSPQTDYILGLNIAPYLIKDRVYDLTHPKTIYVNKILQVLKNHSYKPYLYNDYKVIIVKNSNFNAFALPGGIIIMYDGIFNNVFNEDQLAAILAHEIGHIEHSHFSKDSDKENYSKLVTMGFENKVNDKVANNLFTKFKKNIENGYSVKEEAEADQAAIRLLYESGYNPKALRDVLEQLKKVRNSYGGANYPEDRVDRLSSSDFFNISKTEPIHVKKRERRFNNVVH